MIEHPVPQNITQYEFHLIGNMTIKQFLMLLAGVIIGFMVYSTNLPGLIMWPVITVIVLIAIAMAFVPYEERMLDEWMVNFVRAIYRPTKFYWRRMARTPDYFAFTAQKDTVTLGPQLDRTPLRQKQVSAFLSSLNTPAGTALPADPLDLFGGNTNTVSALFESVPAASNVLPGTSGSTPQKPSLQVRSRPLGASVTLFAQDQTGSNMPTSAPTLPPPPTGIISMETNEPVQSEASTSNNMPVTREARVAAASQSVISVEAAPTQEETPAPAEPTTENLAPAPDHYLTADSARAVSNPTAIQPVIFNRQMPFPSLPDKPNLLLGMVHAGKNIVPGAIVEILDANGTTVRAMKTNTLGQFYISTPLSAGTYTIETEANGQQFPVYSLEVSNTVLDPIDIQAVTEYTV